MVLIHCAMLCEAQAFIEYYKLNMIQKKKLFGNDKLMVYVSGIGKDNLSGLEEVLQTYTITKAINIGIAGTNDTSLELGSLVSATKNNTITYRDLKTVDTPQTTNDEISSIIYDMEGKYFFDITKEYISEDNIYIFKVISDYLDDTILPKDSIKQMIQKNIKKIDEYIR